MSTSTELFGATGYRIERDQAWFLGILTMPLPPSAR